VPGVSMMRGRTVNISADTKFVYHIDGEPHVGGPSVDAFVHPAALRVLSAVG
jgi:diacylglycerol kinase family enzyme